MFDVAKVQTRSVVLIVNLMGRIQLHDVDGALV